MTRKKSSRKGKEVTGDSSESLEVIVSNEYLLTEILLRVPAKSLMRFKCVAKHWRSLISDPKFCSIHTLQNPSSLISGICFYFNPWSLTEQIKFASPHRSTESFPKVFLPKIIPNIQMIHACNGLVLWKKGHSSANSKIYIVCNFTTQEYRVLPEIGGFSLSHALPACLAFDPSKSLQYKVVLVKHNYEGTSYEIDIYSSITGSSKRVFISEAPSTGTPLGHIAFWNGSVHWLNLNMFHLKFEVDAERLTSFPLPPRYMSLHDYCFMYFGECGGHLYYIVSKSDCPMNVSVLELEPDQCCWIVKYEVELRFSISLSPNPFCYFLVLGVVNTKYSDALVLAIRPGKVVYYDLKSEKMKVLCVFPPRDIDEIYLYFAYAFQFIVSLSPV